MKTLVSDFGGNMTFRVEDKEDSNVHEITLERRYLEFEKQDESHRHSIEEIKKERNQYEKKCTALRKQLRAKNIKPEV